MKSPSPHTTTKRKEEIKVGDIVLAKHSFNYATTRHVPAAVVKIDRPYWGLLGNRLTLTASINWVDEHYIQKDYFQKFVWQVTKL